jgi:hypothetical protein
MLCVKHNLTCERAKKYGALYSTLWLKKMVTVISNVMGLKGLCHKIFKFRFFAEIFTPQGALPVSLTPVANEKNFTKR